MGKANWTLVLVLGSAVIILGILVIPDLKAISPSSNNIANLTQNLLITFSLVTKYYFLLMRNSP